ncbi:MAG: DNA repair and recombination protein RadA [Candidatus Aenigmarchaeota archaeon]|nr:DNA repair and recombination protein RadA [Candidatus Aenigmarchaeota archaeon]
MVKKKEVNDSSAPETVLEVSIQEPTPNTEPAQTDAVESAPVEEAKVSRRKKITNVADLPGVGEKTAEKLKEQGFEDMMAIAAAGTGELAERADLGEATAAKIIQAARDALDMGFETAADFLVKRTHIGKVSTGSNALNTLIGGGVETQAITEAHGAFGSSKSQLGFQLCVNVQLPPERGGLGKNAILIDTEGTFRPERIKQMAEALGIDPEQALKNVFVARAYNSDHQILLVEKLGDEIRKRNIGIVVIDSITSHFRSDYLGRGTLANRQQKLNRHLHALQRLADVHNVAVYMTNQVMARPDVLFGDPTAPVGGHILGHLATYRLYLRKSKGEKRVAKLIDSPYLPEGEAAFAVKTEGIRDTEV